METGCVSETDPSWRRMMRTAATSAGRNIAAKPRLQRRQRILLLLFHALGQSSCRIRPVVGHAWPLLLLELLHVDVTTAERCKARR
jgi:hypothetical protein